MAVSGHPTTNESNRLAGQTSAYLRSAAHQPVHWFPWCAEAFQRAQELDRSILLDIGAVWCHWCHVMDSESYENPATAEIINNHFIAIKVDRDEHPEIDGRYQEAVRAITHQGGWPLTAFLTPSGRVFFGGTYFPPTDRHGQRGFPEVLLAVADFYRNHRGDAQSQADTIAALLSQHADRARPGELSRVLIECATEEITGHFDPVNGGFGGAPKFPHPSAVEFLLAQHFFALPPSLENVIRRTLTKMAQGGIHDQIGGGFHRYSTDARWIVPHFEKVLYDNTELLRNYAQAYALFGDPIFAETARGITSFLTGTLADQVNGGLYASQDADVGLCDDGDYFTWTLDEVRAVCTADETAALVERYDIRAHGEMHHDPARNVLYVAADFDVIAAKTGKSEDELLALVESGKARLCAARAKRPAPFVDPTIYSGWNGLAISAILLAADHLDLASAERLALRSLDRLITDTILPDGRVAHALGSADPRGLLEDGAFLGRALLDAYERFGHTTYIQSARRIADDLINRLWDEDEGGFFDKAPDPAAIGLLVQPRKPIQDSPTPSANAVAAELLIRLSELTGLDHYRDYAQHLLAAFSGAAGDLGIFGASYFTALNRFLRGSSTAVVVGPKDDPRADALWTAARRACRPYKSLRRLTIGEENAGYPALPLELLAMVTSPQTMGYFCAGHACALPTDDPSRFAETIVTFARTA